MNLWVTLVGAGVVVLEAMSLWGSLQTRRELASGRASREAFVDYTGELDPIALDKLIGSPGVDQRYPSEHWRKLRRSTLVVVFDQPVLSTLLILMGLSGAVFSTHPMAPFLVFTAAAWSAVGFVFAFFAGTQFDSRVAHPIDELILCDLGTEADGLPQLWGAPITTGPHPTLDAAEVRTYRPSNWFELRIAVWKGQVHEITVHSAYPAPRPDLSSMMRRYGDGKRWRVLDYGFQYLREDDAVNLWCSRLPVIGVSTRAFRAKAGPARAHPSQPVAAYLPAGS